MEQDVQAGKGKPYHQEMIAEMNQELADKHIERDASVSQVERVNFPENYIVSVKYDIQTLIGLLDADVQNPALLYPIVRKYVSTVYIQRETNKMFLTIQFKVDDIVLYEKILVTEFR